MFKREKHKVNCGKALHGVALVLRKFRKVKLHMSFDSAGKGSLSVIMTVMTAITIRVQLLGPAKNEGSLSEILVGRSVWLEMQDIWRPCKCGRTSRAGDETTWWEIGPPPTIDLRSLQRRTVRYNYHVISQKIG